jgi:effector-binding domain-containing protein
MTYEVHIQEVARQPIAVARARATAADLSARIRELLDDVYQFLVLGTVHQTGHNLVLYWNEPGKNLLLAPEGVLIEVGVQVASPFASDVGSRVVCSATPAGTVATAAHWGPYEQLGQAHEAVLNWCGDHGRAVAGPNWELYGDWSDRPEDVRTDVFYLLK